MAEGDQDKDHIPADIIIKIEEQDKSGWSRRGHHLYQELDITLKESLLGFKREIKHLDGRSVMIGMEGLTQPLSRMVVKEEGMPNKNTGENGDLYITFKVNYPQGKLKPELEESIKKLML